MAGSRITMTEVAVHTRSLNQVSHARRASGKSGEKEKEKE